jgi:drug/metabolite transporter (DMT)-like permease
MVVQSFGQWQGSVTWLYLIALLPVSCLSQVYQAPRILQSPFAPSSQAATLRFRLLDKQLLLLAVPTLFDLVGAVLLNVGLLAVTASATQMLRQSLLLFAALMGVCLWGKRLNSYHLTGLTGCLVSKRLTKV